MRKFKFYTTTSFMGYKLMDRINFTMKSRHESTAEYKDR